MEFLVIQGCIVIPILTSLLMGPRSRKMSVNTYLFVFAYWLMCSIEAAVLLETAMLSNVYEHVIYTTEAILSIVMIITNSYAIVTLCSFLTPIGSQQHNKTDKKFDFIYRMFVGVAGVFFAELPLLIARIQIILADNKHNITQGSFYIWIVKDILFGVLIIPLLLSQKLKGKYMKYFSQSCAPPFDNPDVFFEPEKRDIEINKQRIRQLPNELVSPKMKPPCNITDLHTSRSPALPTIDEHVRTEVETRLKPEHYKPSSEKYKMKPEHYKLSSEKDNGLKLKQYKSSPEKEQENRLVSGHYKPSPEKEQEYRLAPEHYKPSPIMMERMLSSEHDSSSPENEKLPSPGYETRLKHEQYSPSSEKKGKILAGSASPILKKNNSNSSLKDCPVTKSSPLPKKVTFKFDKGKKYSPF